MSRRGFSLLELLAVLAVLGLLVLASASLLPQMQGEVHAFDASNERHHERWMSVRRLQADIARAERAQAGGSGLLLEIDGRPIRWGCRGGNLVRDADRRRSFRFPLRGCRFRRELRPGGELILYELGTEPPLHGAALRNGLLEVRP